MPYQIAGIPVIRTTFTGTEFIAGQDAAGGAGSTWRAALRDVLTNVDLQRTVYVSNTTISSGESGRVISNSGAGSDLTFTLPPGGVGLWYVIENDTTAYTLTIDPNGSQVIRGGGAGKYLRMLVPGALVIEWNASTSRWDVNEGFNLVAFEP